MPPTIQHAVGSEVHIAPEYADSWPKRAMVHNSTFIVEDVPGPRGRTTYTLRHKTAGAVRLKAYPFAVAAGPHPGSANAEVVPVPTVFDSGTVVEYKDGSQPGLWVVTGYTDKGHKVYPLGGSPTGRRNVSGLRLQVVELDLGEE